MIADRYRPARAALAILLLALVPAGAGGYEVATHAAMIEGAGNSSTVDQKLRESLELDGLDEAVERMTLREWLSRGAKNEDAFPRFLNHFHNPLADWSEAGFTPIRGQSSILWGQNPAQGFPGWSWLDVRGYFRDALTAPRPADRARSLARTFEGLGRLAHLVQDAASPAHTRDDPHRAYNYESLVRDLESKGFTDDEDDFRGLLARPIAPDPAWQALPADPRAPVPIARLIDTDRFAPGGDPGVTTERLIGLAEYTNVNFFSEDTVFDKAFPYPTHSSVIEADFPIVLATGTHVTRRYLAKVADGDSGYRLATVGFLRRYLQRYQLDPGRFRRREALDEAVYRDYAERLVPRAVGYSAALLDYFFRGSLDVDLVDDPGAPGGFSARGVNASEEALGAGSLGVFAEDPAGRRSLLGAVEVRTPILPGGALPDVAVAPPDGAARFVAVFRGALGHETPSRTFPGAVLGKVFRGVRVEEVFSDGTRWKVRTPTGVFDLPFTAADVELVQWGDADSRLVVRAPLGPGQPSRVAAYDARRLPGSRAFAVSGDTALQLDPVGETVFPFGIALGTTVTLDQTIEYRQQLVRFEHRTILDCVPAGPGFCVYAFDRAEADPPAVETVAAETLHFTESFPIVLDEAHLLGPGAKEPRYRWLLQDVAVDAAGRLLGLVLVFLTRPAGEPVSLPVFGIDRASGAATPTGQVLVGPSFPAPMTSELLWALVDLGSGAVLASTAEPTITIVGHSAFEGGRWGSAGELAGGVWRHEVIQHLGGPLDGIVDAGWSHSPLAFAASTTRVAGRVRVDARFGDESLIVTGWRRAELAEPLRAAGLLGFEIGRDERTNDFTYDCSPGAGCGVVSVASSQGLLLAPPARLTDARRARPAPPEGERLVFLGESDPGLLAPAGAFLPTGHVVVWDPAVPAAALRVQLRPGFRYLGTATPSVATVWFQDDDSLPEQRAGSYLLPLDGGEPAFFAGQDLTASYVVLAPGYLYNVDDLRFYRPTPPLQATALPAALADVADDRLGDFHALRLR